MLSWWSFFDSRLSSEHMGKWKLEKNHKKEKRSRLRILPHCYSFMHDALLQEDGVLDYLLHE